MPKRKQPFAIEDAKRICEAHEIANLMADEEERDLLRENNNGLYWSYIALLQIAYPDDARWNP